MSEEIMLLPSGTENEPCSEQYNKEFCFLNQ